MSDRELQFSIVVPVYQVERYLTRCLNSILAQKNVCFEVLCVYDPSEDGSYEILKRYREKDSRCRIIMGRNAGLSGARNDGMDQAKGKYLLFMDSDDYYLPNSLERMWRILSRENPDILVFGAELHPCGKVPPMNYYASLTTADRLYPRFQPEALFREPGATPFVWRNCFSRAFLARTGVRFDEQIRLGEDLLLQLCLFPQTGIIRFTRERFYCYRWLRPGSLQSVYNLDRACKIRGHMEIVKKTRQYWEEYGITGMDSRLFVLAIDLLYFEAARLDASQAAGLREEWIALLAGFPERPKLSPFYRKCLECLLGEREFPEERTGFLGYYGKLNHLLNQFGIRNALTVCGRIALELVKSGHTLPEAE